MNKNIISPIVSILLAVGSIIMMLCLVYIGLRCVTEGDMIQRVLGYVILGLDLAMGFTMPKVFWGKN